LPFWVHLVANNSPQCGCCSPRTKSHLTSQQATRGRSWPGASSPRPSLVQVAVWLAREGRVRLSEPALGARRVLRRVPVLRCRPLKRSTDRPQLLPVVSWPPLVFGCGESAAGTRHTSRPHPPQTGVRIRHNTEAQPWCATMLRRPAAHRARVPNSVTSLYSFQATLRQARNTIDPRPTFWPLETRGRQGSGQKRRSRGLDRYTVRLKCRTEAPLEPCRLPPETLATPMPSGDWSLPSSRPYSRHAVSPVRACLRLLRGPAEQAGSPEEAPRA
jgi:hypothetical protein